MDDSVKKKRIRINNIFDSMKLFPVFLAYDIRRTLTELVIPCRNKKTVINVELNKSWTLLQISS